MEVPNELIADADRRGILTSLPGNIIKFRASVYADDLVIFLLPNSQDFNCIRQILELFAGASRLTTDLNKCLMTPICYSDADIEVVQQVFPCQVQHFPCQYLGAPMSLSRLHRSDEQRLVDKVAVRILTWKAGLLNATGQATLMQTTLSAIPIHISISCCLSDWAISQIDKRHRAFLWSSTESMSGGKCKIAWPIVCSPKDYGGLGITDLKVLGYALRLRREWLGRTETSLAWALLPSMAERVVDMMFRASATVHLGNGESARFWTNSWLPEGPICSFAPSLFSAIDHCRRHRTVKEAMLQQTWVRDIVGAPTAAVLCDYVVLWEKLEDVHLQVAVSDRFIWRWTPDGKYTASSAYRSFFNGMSSLVGARQLWKVKVPPKVKFFFWIALHGRLWTVERRWRHGLQQVGT